MTWTLYDTVTRQEMGFRDEPSLDVARPYLQETAEAWEEFDTEGMFNAGNMVILDDNGTRYPLFVATLEYEGERYTLDAFLAKYGEGLWSSEKFTLEKLAVGQSYTGGGGACAEWTVTRVS